MSPDSQQPQNIPPLPEVPPVTPPAQEPQPVPPAIDQPVAAQIPIVQPTPQPIVQPAPAPAPFSQPVTPPSSQFPQQSAAFPQTAPIAGPQMVSPVMPGQPASKKKLGLLIGSIAGGLVVIGALITILLLFVFPSGKIAESDLVSATTDGTTYLRPKQWQSVTVDSTSGYGDKKGKDGKSNAAIFVKKLSYIYSDVTSLSSDQLSTIRSTITDSISTTKAEDDLKDEGGCTSVKDVKVTESSISNSSMIVVFRIDGTCVQDDVSGKIVYLGTIGDDGYGRAIVLLATDNVWKQNETVFDKMLGSVDQE